MENAQIYSMIIGFVIGFCITEAITYLIRKKRRNRNE